MTARLSAEERYERRLQSARAWRARNKTQMAEIRKRYRTENLERCKVTSLASAKRHYEKNRTKVLAYVADWQRANPEKRKTARARWNQKNPAWNRARIAKRRARLLRATPPWADQERITVVYADAERLTRESGIEHHVDHAVPLISKVVCGLHVELNLQILRASENHKKSNRFQL